MNLILFGPPGAGKGTQADNLVKHYNLHKISTGDLLRDEINKKTELGKYIKNIIDKGSFVSDEIINNLIVKILENKKYYNKLVFDGYPRNLFQAKELDSLIGKYNQKISCVLSLKVDDEHIKKRYDDNEEIIANRIDTYVKKTLPILDYYKEQKLLHEVNGIMKIDKIFEQIQGIIGSLET